MLIFGDFESNLDANNFRTYIEEVYKCEVIFCRDREEFNKHEVYPYQLDFPIVLVERDWEVTDIQEQYKIEQEIERSVYQFKGNFIGT